MHMYTRHICTCTCTHIIYLYMHMYTQGIFVHTHVHTQNTCTYTCTHTKYLYIHIYIHGIFVHAHEHKPHICPCTHIIFVKIYLNISVFANELFKYAESSRKSSHLCFSSFSSFSAKAPDVPQTSPNCSCFHVSPHSYTFCTCKQLLVPRAEKNRRSPVSGLPSLFRISPSPGDLLRVRSHALFRRRLGIPAALCVSCILEDDSRISTAKSRKCSCRRVPDGSGGTRGQESVSRLHCPRRMSCL